MVIASRIARTLPRPTELPAWARVDSRIVDGHDVLFRPDGQGLFRNMPNPFRAVRYHSLIVQADSLPPGFIVTATAEDDGEIMGLRHEVLPIEGMQFHPESVMTEDGMRIVQNFVAMVERSSLPV